VYIVGDLGGLIALRKAVEAALDNQTGLQEAFTNDHEGFQVVVARVDSSTEWDRLRLPYPLEGVPEQECLDPWELPQVKKVQVTR
jgi:hypothetical protein